MSAPVWVNPVSNFEIIPNLDAFSATLQVQISTVSGSVRLISGAFPNGISITNQYILDGMLTVTLHGTVEGLPTESLYRFTLRATDASGSISDQRFTAKVFAVEPFLYASTITQGSNIGIFPDGSFINIVLPIIDSTTNANMTYSLFSGAMPSGLNLSSNGMLYGYPYPSQLLETDEGFDDISWDNSPFDVDPSVVSKTYAFNVQVSDGYQIEFIPYSITIERSDVFANANVNLSEEYYHSPIFTNANIVTASDISSTLNLGTFSTDSYFYYQFQGVDFENDEIAFDIQPPDNQTSQSLYSTSTGVAIANDISSTSLLPSNIALNGNTGWLSGYLNEISTSITSYDFYVRVYKVFSEPYESSINVDYAVELPFSIVNYCDQIAINSLAIDVPSTNFDGATLIFVGDSYASDYSFGNIVGFNTSSAIVATNTPWANVATGNIVVPVSQQNGVWQFQRITNEMNPRTGIVEPFYQLNYLEEVSANVGIIVDKTIISSNTLSLVNNVVERNNVFEVASNVAFTQITATNPYESFLDVTMNLVQDYSQAIVWNDVPNLGSVSSGVPVQLELSASVTNEELSTISNPATTEVYMQLVSANINATGQGYSMGNVLTIVGGAFSNAATVTVSSVGVNGQVTGIILNNVSNQLYSALPALSNTLVTGGSGSGASLDLSFGVESVIVTFAGQYNNDLTIGFTSANETVAATANCALVNGQILDINVTYPGSGYTFVPLALINTIEFQLMPTVNYQLISGSLPMGLQLFSNGMIAGRPSFQNSASRFTFTAQASVGLNSIESGEEFTNTLTSNQTYTLTLTNNSQPITNMYLALLLSEEGSNTLFSALNNNQLIPSAAIYRQYDPFFGIVSSLRSLMAYGLGTNTNLLENMTTALSEYHNAKTLSFDSLMLVPALDLNHNTQYSVVVLVLRDEYTTVNGNSYSGQLTINDSGNTIVAYPGTQPNMINQLVEYLGPFNASYQPLWLQNTIVDATVIGSNILIPLVYTTPEAGPDVLFNLETYFSGNNTLNNLTFYTDRYVWDAGMIINFDLTTNSFPENATPDSYLIADEGSSYLIFPKRNIIQ